MKFKQRISHLLEKTRSVRLIGFSILFTSLTIAGQTYALDTIFYAGNDIDFYDPSCAYTSSSTGLSGTDVEEKVWNFLKSQGLSDQQTAGIMGNMEIESGFIPTRFQADVSFDPWDSQQNHGWGLVQWDSGRRFTAPDKGVLGTLRKEHPELVKYVDIQYDWAKQPSLEAKIPASDLDALTSFELTYLVQESKARPVVAQGYGNANTEWDTLKLQQTVANAANFWNANFEVSADTSTDRVTNGNKIYSEFAGKNTTGSSSSTGSTTSTSTSSQPPVIYLDPAHGGSISQYIDPQSGLADSDTNTPATTTSDDLEIAQRVQTALTTAGYTVVMSRSTNTEQLNQRDRANAAKTASAVMGVSIDTLPGAINQVWPQRVGTSRSYSGKTDTFSDASLAQKSQSYADDIAKTRTASENHNVTTDPSNSQEAATYASAPSKGNTPLVSLWSSIPWVYNVIGQDQGSSLSSTLKQQYADGITKGIEQALPYTPTDQCGNPAFTGGNLAQTILAYAWPDYHPAVYINKEPAYATALARAVSQGRYVGGINYVGIDCGGFVTTLMIDSGFEPNYNHSGLLKQGAGNTLVQQPWLQQNWQTLGPATSIDTGKLQQGDVAISSDHTFVFAGSIPGFHSNVASASLDERAPMAGHEPLNMAGFTWYRKK